MNTVTIRPFLEKSYKLPNGQFITTDSVRFGSSKTLFQLSFECYLLESTVWLIKFSCHLPSNPA